MGWMSHSGCESYIITFWDVISFEVQQGMYVCDLDS